MFKIRPMAIADLGLVLNMFEVDKRKDTHLVSHPETKISLIYFFDF